MLDKFSVQKTESEIMKETVSLVYDGGDVQIFLARADKVYSQARFNEKAKFDLLRDGLKSDQIPLQFVLYRSAKDYESEKKLCVEYAENLKMMGGTTTTKIVRSEKRDKDSKDSKIDELCKQVENLHLMMTKQPRVPRQAEPLCYK